MKHRCTIFICSKRLVIESDRIDIQFWLRRTLHGRSYFWNVRLHLAHRLLKMLKLFRPRLRDTCGCPLSCCHGMFGKKLVSVGCDHQPRLVVLLKCQRFEVRTANRASAQPLFSYNVYIYYIYYIYFINKNFEMTSLIFIFFVFMLL